MDGPANENCSDAMNLKEKKRRNAGKPGALTKGKVVRSLRRCLGGFAQDLGCIDPREGFGRGGPRGRVSA